ncbi:MAG: hypothetical protein M1827_006121 [Pycnora praestabilis]|nr:MAG: hypothetical protein M1827_006121 [Pycnora praestabilis]
MLYHSIPWKTQINFASALLLHSCITILLKESFNSLEVFRRLSLRHWRWKGKKKRNNDDDRHLFDTSIVLDAYTSVFSLDMEGELAELYFTNTGLLLLGVSLASSVAMNLLLSSILLNMIVAGTFGLAFIASLVIGTNEVILPIMALRRAARFIWSDTPFVNFFSLIYIATVLKGQSTLRLQDYVTFRSIAILELIFMKAKLAASNPEKQEKLMKQIIESEWVLIKASPKSPKLGHTVSKAQRNSIVAFTTRQRLSVMLFKTSIGHHFGCLQGSLGPSTSLLPKIGHFIDEEDCGWRLYRITDATMILADCLSETYPKDMKIDSPKTAWLKFIAHAHGVLLRRLGKVRVVYIVRDDKSEYPDTMRGTLWHSNINLVTGVTRKWLDKDFTPGLDPAKECLVA